MHKNSDCCYSQQQKLKTTYHSVREGYIDHGTFIQMEHLTPVQGTWRVMCATPSPLLPCAQVPPCMVPPVKDQSSASS